MLHKLLLSLNYTLGIVCVGVGGFSLPDMAFIIKIICLFLFVLLLYVPSQQLWSLRDGQFTFFPGQA